MKKLCLFLIFALAGCSGFQIKDDATTNLLAYAAGKTMAISINKVKPEVDKDLTNEWVEFMERNAGNETVQPSEMMPFFNRCVMIVTAYEFDKYGLIGDLTMLMSIYGGQTNEVGQMTTIQPVPYAILKTFEIGYANGRAVARK